MSNRDGSVGDGNGNGHLLGNGLHADNTGRMGDLVNIGVGGGDRGMGNSHLFQGNGLSHGNLLQSNGLSYGDLLTPSVGLETPSVGLKSDEATLADETSLGGTHAEGEDGELKDKIYISVDLHFPRYQNTRTPFTRHFSQIFTSVIHLEIYLKACVSFIMK